MKTQTKLRILKTDIMLIAIALLIGFTHQQCSNSTANQHVEAKQETVPVTITSETIQYLVQPVDVSGMIVASKDHRLSFKTGGIIEKILVNEGQTVKKGQVLASLKLDEIEAQVHQAQLGLNKAKRDFERVKNLYADSVVTLEQFQNVTTALELARSNATVARYNRKYSTIISPVNGSILMKLYEADELVGAGMPVFVIASNEEKWQVKAGVSDKEVVRISIADDASVKIDAYPNETIKATVSQIGDAPDQMTGLYEIRLSLIDFKQAVKPGFFVNAKIFPAKRQAYLTIPINAVCEGIGNTVSYFTLSADKSKALKKTTKVEWIQNDMVVLNSNVESTETIINDSQKQLTHLTKVKVINPTNLP